MAGKNEKTRARTRERSSEKQLAEALRRSEELLARERVNLQTMFDSVNVGLLLLDESGALERVNETVARWVGTSPPVARLQPGDFLGCIHALGEPEGCGHSTHCADCPVRNSFQSVFKTKRAIRGLEAHAQLQLGGCLTDLWLEISADPLILDGRHYVILSLIDITARKKHEESLRKAHEHGLWLARFPEENPNAVMRVSFDGTVLYRNPTVARLPGWNCEVGRQLSQPELKRLLLKVIQHNSPTEEDILLEDTYYSVAAVPIPAEGYANFYGRNIAARRKTEDALRESERRLRWALQGAGGGAWDWDLVRGEAWWSEEMFALWGVEPGTRMRLDNSLEFVHDQDREMLRGAVEEAIAQRKEYRSEFRIRHPARGERWMSSVGCPFFDDSGRAVRMLGISLDITERKQAEEAMRRGENLLRALTDNSPDAIYVKDVQSRWLMANPAVLSVVGKSAEEALGKSDLELYSNPVIGRAILENDRRILERGQAESFEEVVDTRGIKRVFMSTKAPWRDAQGNLAGIVGVSRDITDRKRVEEAVRESEEKLRVSFANAAIGFAMTSPEGRFIDVNPAYCVLTGYEREELQKTEFQQLIHPDDHAENMRLIGEMLAGKSKAFVVENRYVRKDGQTVRVRKSVSLVRGPGGEPRWIIALVEDITARWRAEEELRRLAQDLRRSNEDLQQFAHAASHDLQEPLRMISGFLKLLKQRYEMQLDDKAREYIRFTVEGANRMSQLITDLLAYSRVDRQEKGLAPTDAGYALAGALANLRGSIGEAGATVTHDTLPAVVADSSQLMQLFQNLIGNAIKFRSPERPCQVHVSAKAEGGRWIFSVRDNSIGIPSNAFGRIFEIFQRLHSRDSYAGTGIGLAICKRIVERHGGRIWVESELGQGSVFYFLLYAL